MPLPLLAQVLLALPFYAVVLFCCYSLAVIGHGLITFPDRPRAELDLLQDIKHARQQLASRGFNTW